MDTENTLAKRISAAGIGAAYDEACKRLLANKQILARIMKTCVEEFRECSIKDIEEKYIEGRPEIANVSVHQDEFDIAMTETLEREVSGMCNLSEGIFENGWNEAWGEAWGEAWDKAKLEDIKNLMKKLGLSAEKSMDILEIPEAERELYKKALKEEAVLQI